LVADCAEAITNGCDVVFEGVIRVHCWAHVIRNIDKKLRMVADKKVGEDLRQDICSLQYAKSEEEFDKASSLWLKKWSKRSEAFVSYFKSEYLEKSTGWYEGRCLNSPSTNNLYVNMF
jgi:transposase-like protein